MLTFSVSSTKSVFLSDLATEKAERTAVFQKMRTRQRGICSIDSIFSCVVIINIVQFSQLPSKIQVAFLWPSDTRNAFWQSRNLAYSAKICTLCTLRKRKLNPITATACTICGLKDTGTRPQTVYFPLL